MASLFTKIIGGEIPGRFVWRDEHCVAFLTIAPISPGHTLVVPIAEVAHWLDLDPELARHLTTVAQSIGKAIQRGFAPRKVGLMIAGLEVPHTYLHVLPINEPGDLDFAKQDQNAKPADLDRAAETIRTELRELGYKQVSA